MKLNLLPTYVSKEGQLRTAIAGSLILVVLSLVLSVFMILKSRGDLQAAHERADEWKPKAEAAVATAEFADTIIQSATGIQRNIKLAEAMDKHNPVYPDLYREVLGYVPAFFRVSAISATPTGETGCLVTMTGIIHTFQNYADLMLALLRIPGASNVSRAGYQITDPAVPALSEQDQVGFPAKPGETPLPSNPLERLDALIAKGSSDPGGFTGTGNFGTTDPGPRGAMPDWSQITVTVTLADRKIQTPLPRATLAKAGPATQVASNTGAAGKVSGVIGGPGGAPTTPGKGGAGGGASAPAPGIRSGRRGSAQEEQ